MTARICVLLAALWLATAAQAQDAAPGWQLQVSANHHLDAAPLQALNDGDFWSQLSPRPGRNLAYLFDETRLSRQSGDWTGSLLARQRVSVVANHDALALGQTAALPGRSSSSQEWLVHAQALGFAGVGLHAERAWPLGTHWQLRSGVQWLGLTRYFEREIQGQAAFDATQQSYQTQLASQRADNRLHFPYQQAQAPAGQGLLFDASLDWSHGPWAAALKLRDVGWLRWAALPQQVATLNTKLSTIDADGFVVYRPLLQGRNTQDVHRRWLTPVSDLQTSWQMAPQGRLSMATTWLPGWGSLPRAGWTQQVGDWEVSAGWRWHEQRAELKLSHGQWQVGLGADTPQQQQRSLTWSLAWSSAGTSTRQLGAHSHRAEDGPMAGFTW